MRIAIADDNIQDTERLTEELTAALSEFGYENERIECFDSGEALLKKFEAGRYDIIFLDIFLGGINGIDTAKEIRRKDKDVRLVFQTTSNDFAAQSYQLNADYYLLKPCTSADVRNMLQRINLDRFEEQRMVEFPDKSRCRAHDIIYTEYSNHKITIHLEENKEHYVWMSHTDLEKILESKGDFFTCTKGILLNLEKIVSFTEDSVKVCNGDYVPVSRARRSDLRKAHADYVFRMLHKGGRTE